MDNLYKGDNDDDNNNNNYYYYYPVQIYRNLHAKTRFAAVHILYINLSFRIVSQCIELHSLSIRIFSSPRLIIIPFRFPPARSSVAFSHFIKLLPFCLI